MVIILFFLEHYRTSCKEYERGQYVLQTWTSMVLKKAAPWYWVSTTGKTHLKSPYLGLNATILMDAVFIKQGWSPEALGPLRGISSKCWLCTRVSHALLHTLTHANKDTLKTTLRHTNLNLRYSSLLSLSPSRLTLVPVNLCTRRNLKQSSKVP